MVQNQQQEARSGPALAPYGPGDAFIDTPWAFDEHHLAWRRTMRDFVSRGVRPGAQERSREEHFDEDVVRSLGQLGVCGLMVPEPYGPGVDLRSLCIAIEELAYADSSIAVTAHVQASNAALFHALTDGRDELREQVLPAAVTGEGFISFGLTEPTGGSDAAAISTRAVRDGDSWVLSGAKQFITNTGTPMSRYVIVFARTDFSSSAKRPAISAFLVPLDAEGVTVAPAYRKLGWKASDTHPLFFENVRLGAASLLGEEGRGIQEALRLLTWARIPIAAMALGLARGCLDSTLDFVQSRQSFGKNLGQHQSVAFALADVAADITTVRTLTYDAAWKYDNGHPIDREAAVAKLVAAEIANKVAYACSELQGGYGFMQDSDVVRHYQDARVLTIGEGTSAVQRLLISRHLGVGA